MRISQEEMGKCLKIHQSAVCRVELGVQKLSVYQILVVSKKFDISPQVLIELTLAGCRR